VLSVDLGVGYRSQDVEFGLLHPTPYHPLLIDSVTSFR
jgi:hypothetical protein